VFVVDSKHKILNSTLQQQIRSFKGFHPGNLGSNLITNQDETDLWRTEWNIAASKLKNMNNLSCPKAKVECIVDCCSTLTSLLQKAVLLPENKGRNHSGGGTDNLLPSLVYTIVLADPDKLYSNIEFISAYARPEELLSEAGFYFTMFLSAVSYIQRVPTCDTTHM